MARLVLLLIVTALVSGCAEETVFRHDGHDPVPGEATPAPQSGPRGGWAW